MRKIAALAALVALLVGAVAPASAATGGGGGSGGGVSIGFSGATISARIQVNVAFTLVCVPVTSLANPDGVTAATYGATVTVDQASGRTIAHASGGDLMPSGQPVTCDGTTVNNLSMSVLSTNVPFHGGSAIVGISVTTYDPACEFCGGEGHADSQFVAKVK